LMGLPDRFIVTFMQQLNEHATAYDWNTESSPSFKVVIAYETVAAALHAKEMSERLAAELKSECGVWKMDLLAHPPLGRQAASAAAAADMIIIAARSAGELPLHVKDWIESWLPQKASGPSVLVALVGEEHEAWPEPPPLCAYLAQIAERASMDFFCNMGHWRLGDFQVTKENVPRGVEGQLAELQKAFQPDSASRGWGIND